MLICSFGLNFHHQLCRPLLTQGSYPALHHRLEAPTTQRARTVQQKAHPAEKENVPSCLSRQMDLPGILQYEDHAHLMEHSSPPVHRDKHVLEEAAVDCETSAVRCSICEILDQFFESRALWIKKSLVVEKY